jgi:integrase
LAARLTDRGIAALKPTDASVLYFDSEVPGLAVRVYSSGKKSFVFDWREDGRQRRVVIGSPPTWTIGKARIHAGRMRLKADTGEAVAPGRGDRVADLIEAWKQVVAVTRRPGTAISYGKSIDSHIVPHFGKADPRTITRNRIVAWHGELAQTKPVAANRALATLSAFLTWLEHDEKVERNFAKGVRRVPENQRQIFLDEAEIEAAHAALDADSNRAAALALRLALLTGARIGEVLTIAPDQIDAGRKVWIKPHTLTKQKRVSIVPLQPEALAIAQELLALGPPEYRPCVHAWARVRAIIGRDDVRIHDLRHSRASALARNGASLMQIGKVLVHASHVTTARYAHLVNRDLRDLVERTS